MSSTSVFRLPDLGEGLTEAEIVTWRVSPGDVVALNDVLAEVETVKAVVELPSPLAGRVQEILVEEGRSVPVGEPLIVIASDDPAIASDDPAAEDGPRVPSARHDDVPDGADGPPQEGRTPVLVGYGPGRGAPRRRRVGRAAARPEADAARPDHRPPAKPPVRLLAKRLGVDLADIAAPGETVTREQVERAAGRAPEPDTVPAETRIPIRGVRKATAQAVTASAFTAPQATMWVDVDLTRTLALVDTIRADPRFGAVRATPLLVIAKALLLAVGRNREINATWDEDNQEIVIRRDVNLGLAVATSRGLVVPNIKAAQWYDLLGLATAMRDVIDRARLGRCRPQELTGGTITITNVGALDVDGAAPILNLHETAIIAVGAIRSVPRVVEGRIVPRDVAQLSITIDHRVADGDLGAKVLGDLKRILQDPAQALLYA